MLTVVFVFLFFFFFRMFSILLCLVYICLLYGLYVPNWKFEHSNLLWSGRVSIIQNVGWHGSVTLCHWMLKDISWILFAVVLIYAVVQITIWLILYSWWSQHVICFLNADSQSFRCGSWVYYIIYKNPKLSYNGRGIYWALS